MKNLLYTFTATLLISCSSSRKINEEISSPKKRCSGVVHLESNCGVIISAQVDGLELKLYPVNLSDDFKKEGIKISFEFSPSRAMQPEKCLVDRVVSMETVQKIK